MANRKINKSQKAASPSKAAANAAKEAPQKDASAPKAKKPKREPQAERT